MGFIVYPSALLRFSNNLSISCYDTQHVANIEPQKRIYSVTCLTKILLKIIQTQHDINVFALLLMRECIHICPYGYR